jgi:acyl carrier protein phosphodiesterase
MNFLAHLYLSGDDNDLKFGNFIGDHVKGNMLLLLPGSIRNGVILHRKIDHYTDHHPVVLQSKERLRPLFRKYAPVITDIFYDHFLAKNWDDYSGVKLHQFADDFYKLTENYQEVMPSRTRYMLPYMISNNWLVSYAGLEGTHKALTGMSKRTSFDSGMERAVEELKTNYPLYEKEFRIFFSDLESYVQSERTVPAGDLKSQI